MSLWVPDVAAVKTVYDKLRKQDPNLPFPYWAKIWASSKAMVTLLEESMMEGMMIFCQFSVGFIGN